MAQRSIIVSHISPAAEASHLDEFFAFCGAVESITFTGEIAADGTKQAIVTFTNEDAMQTALLLSDAIIVDSPIQISAPTASTVLPSVPSSAANLPSPPAVEPRTAVNPSDDEPKAPKKTAEEVVAGIVIAGYFKGEQLIREVKRRAQEFDEKHQVKAKTQTALSPALDKAKTTALQLDDKYRLQQKASLASFAFQRALSAGFNTVKSVAKGAAAPTPAPTVAQPSAPAAPTPCGRAVAAPAQLAVLGAAVGQVDAAVHVLDVPLGSAAAEAGLQAGDVLVRWGDAAVATTEQLLAAIALSPRGHTIGVTVHRAGAETHLKLQLPEEGP